MCGKPPMRLLSTLKKNNIDIVIIDQIGFASTPQYLVPAVQAHMDRFEMLYTVPNPDTYILKFKRNP